MKKAVLKALLLSSVHKAQTMCFIVRLFPVLLLWAVVTYITFINVKLVCAQEISPHESGPTIVLAPEERAWLKAHPDIQLGYTDTLEPEVIVNTDGTYSGMVVDFLGVLNDKLGTNIGLSIHPIPELLENARNKRIDGILNLHPEYADNLGLLKTKSYWPAYPAVFARKGTSFKSPDDFADKRVALIDKVYITQKLMEQFGKRAVILKVDDALAGLQSVQKGEADFFLGFSYNSFFIPKYQLFDVLPVHVFIDSPERFGIGIRADWPELVSILNKGISGFSAEEIHAIIAKWSYMPQKSEAIELTAGERAWIAQNHAVRVRVTDQAPYCYNRDGKPVGIAVDFLNTVSKRTGIKFHFIIPSPPFSTDLRGLIRHTGPDLFGSLTPTPEREKKILFTEPYVSSPKFIFTRDDAEFVATMKSLRGKSIAVVKDYLVHRELAKDYPDINLMLFKSNRDALRAVSSGSAFAFIGGLLSTPFMINEFGLRNLKAAAPSALQNATVAMAIRSDWPELRDIMNKVFDAMSESEKAAIINKWSSVRIDYGIRPADILKWILMVSGAASFLILLFVFWNRNLAKQVKERTADLESSVQRLSAEIAERKRVEELLRESEIRYRAVVEDQTELICRFQRDATLTFVNEAYCSYFDKKREDLIGCNWLSFLPEEERAKALQQFTSLSPENPVITYEHRVISPTGECFWQEWTDRAIFDELGHPVEFQSVGRDITSRKQTEEALGRNKEFIQSILMSIEYHIAVLDRDGVILTVNDSWMNFARENDVSSFELIGPGVNYLDICRRAIKDSDELACSALEGISAMLDGSHKRFELEYPCHSTSEQRWFLMSVMPLIGTEGGVVVAHSNITSRKQSEQEILAYQERLKALASQLTLAEERERRAIAADLHDQVGHSLVLARMQLNGILEAKSPLEQKILTKDISNILLKALQETRSLIFELSSPTMNERGLSAAISEWLEEQIASRRGIKTEFIDNIREEHKKALDENIRAILFRNVRELLINVVKHARANKVRIHLTEEANGLKIVVDDDGVGFAPGDRSIEPKQTGGFGLFSIQERMADLGGSLDIQSEPGKGCRVVLTVPVDERHNEHKD